MDLSESDLRISRSGRQEGPLNVPGLGELGLGLVTLEADLGRDVDLAAVHLVAFQREDDFVVVYVTISTSSGS